MTERTLGYSRAYLADGDRSEGPLVFTASSEVLNRHGFSLRHDGWRLDNFANNPVVLWMHIPFRPPIGRASAYKSNKRVMAEVTFDSDDELARQVESKYRRGFLNAVSVGLDFVDEDGGPLRWWGLSDDEIRDEAFYDLAELSAVSIPADPTAVREKQRLALSRIGRELVELFDEQEQPASPVTAEQLHDAVRAEMARLGINPDPPGQQPDGVDKETAAALSAAFNLKGSSVV